MNKLAAHTRRAIERLRSLRATLLSNVDAGRRILKMLFPEGILADPVQLPEGKRFRKGGTATLGPMLVYDDESTNLASPRGFEPLLAA